MTSKHYEEWMAYIRQRRVLTKEFGGCLKTGEALHYLRIHGAQSVIETDGGIEFVMRGEVYRMTPVFLNGTGWLYPITALDDLIYTHDDRE